MPEKKKVNKQPEKTVSIYLGPPIPGVTAAGTVYSNGLTPQLDTAIAELPAIKMLLIETTKAVQARKELRNNESAISICYKKISEYAAMKGVKG